VEPHGADLVATIAIALGAGFVAGYLARLIGLPAIVGYLLAGVAVGPFTPGLVADPGSALQLAEVGVALLMFGVGLHFSLRDLARVYRVAVPGAIGQIAAATGLGTLAGLVFGWELRSALVLGLAISVGSTETGLGDFAEATKIAEAGLAIHRMNRSFETTSSLLWRIWVSSTKQSLNSARLRSKASVGTRRQLSARRRACCATGGASSTRAGRTTGVPSNWPIDPRLLG
jgi:Sodium/hydrogen exchanger family